VVGSDYPAMMPFQPYSEAFQFIRRAGLPEPAIDQILYRNVLGLFPQLSA
jgi:hypothetical protein